MMRRGLLGALFGVCVVLLAVPMLHADDGGGQPLYCFTTSTNGVKTFFPRGDHFAHLPGAKITVVFNPNGATDGNKSFTNPNAADSIAAVQSAFSVWQAQSCSGQSPDVSFDTSGTAAMVANSNDRINTVNWLGNGNWTFDQTTVAATTNTYTSDTGFMIDADIQFNGQYFAWRNNTKATGCQSGSADPNNICYDIETVALHEIGHFLGFNHVACTASSMYPSASGKVNATTVSENETAAVCSLYPPHTGSASSFGETCTTTKDCASNLTCLKPAGSGDTDQLGWCSQVCTKSADCPVAFICEVVNTQGPICVPGVHLANVPVSDPVAAQDLCQPCSDPVWCDTGLCASGRPNNICTQPCAKDGSFSCPVNFTCIQPDSTSSNSFCYPVDDSVCPATWTGAKLNETCYNNYLDPNTPISLPCEAGLNCVQLVNPNYTIAACLQYCDSVNAGATCPTGSECCYGFDQSTGACLNSGSSASGGCVQMQSTGDSCALPSQSVCQNGVCEYVTDPDNAQCYDLCDSNGSCPSGEKCFSTYGLCCDAQYFTGNGNSCYPKPGVCKRSTDVSCSTGTDCISGLCQTYNGQSFCTVGCVLNSDCPGTYTDVNDDGKPDGGATCTQVDSGKKVCVPNQGPASPPACASTASAGGGGCGCAGTGPADLWWLAALAVAAFLRLRRTC